MKYVYSITFLILIISQSEAQNRHLAPIYVTRTGAAIKLDGRINEEAWQQGNLLEDFVQGSPVPLGKTSFKTEARLLYDNANFYIGIKAFDTTHHFIVNNLQRDTYFSNEDGISIMIDSYNDKIHALLFYTNTAGARYDQEVSENGENRNAAYNTFWNVKTSRQTNGYEAEFVIPFSSLRFKPGEKVKMGFKILRQIGRLSEVEMFPTCDSNLSGIVSRVNSEAEIIFENLKARSPLFITPYIKASYQNLHQINNNGTAYESTHQFFDRNFFSKNKTADKVISNAGIDAKIGLSKNLTLDATLNTDFAQAEVDNRVINFTRFNIFLPEKRQFFLEANDYLNFLMPANYQLFNSRNIGIEQGFRIPILGGLRLTGKSNGWQIGALDIQTKGLAEAGIQAQNFSVFHLSKDLYKNGSTTSIFFANRMTTNSDSISNQTLACDYLHRLNQKWTLALNLAATKDNNRAKFFDENMLVNVAVFKAVTFGYSNFLTYMKSDRNFNPMSGFYEDKGFHLVYGVHSYTFQIKNKPALNFFDISGETFWKYRSLEQTYLEGVQYAISPSLGFKNGMNIRNKCILYNRDSLYYPWYFNDDIVIPQRKFIMYGNEFDFTSARNSQLLYTTNVIVGRFYGGNRMAIQPQIIFTVNQHLTFTVSYYFNHIQFPKTYTSNGNALFESHLAAIKLNFSFNPHIALNTLWQYDNLSRSLGANVRLRYNPKEGSDLYLVYNPILNTQIQHYTPTLPFIQQQSIILKYARTFVANG